MLVFDGDGALERQLEQLPATAPPVAEDAESAASSMIYTSGTTGKPKGAVRRANVDASSGAALLGLIGYAADDVYLTTGPLYHSGPGGFAGDRPCARQHRGGAAQV